MKSLPVMSKSAKNLKPLIFFMSLCLRVHTMGEMRQVGGISPAILFELPNTTVP